MLTKAEYQKMQKELAACNCTYAVAERPHRKGATSMAHSLFLQQADPKDLIIRDVEKIACDYPEDWFHIQFDGIAGFTVTMNDKVLLAGDYYAVEEYYQISGQEFHTRLKLDIERLDNLNPEWRSDADQ